MLLRFIFLIFFLSCSHVKDIKANKSLYIQKDTSGDFVLSRESGLSAGKDEYIVKNQLQQESSVLEKSVSISQVAGRLLNPKISQYTVWINKNVNFSEISYDQTGSQLIVNLKSLDQNGIKFFPLPQDKKNICFFSQVIECARFAGFIDKPGAEPLPLNIIWDGYPFFHQLLENFPRKIYSPANLTFEGIGKSKGRKFILRTEGEEIIFELDSSDRLLRKIWVSKGITIEKINDTL